MTKTSDMSNAVVIERIFDASIELIWQMWIQPEHFKQWYGPQGFSVPVAEMDVRVGGNRLICMEMQTPDRTMKMWTTGEFTEIIPNQRLVYTESMSDENGNVVSMPGSEYPMTTEVTVVLEDLGGRTKMVMTHAGIPAGSGGNAGWEQAFDKLVNHLETVTFGNG